MVCLPHHWTGEEFPATRGSTTQRLNNPAAPAHRETAKSLLSDSQFHGWPPSGRLCCWPDKQTMDHEGRGAARRPWTGTLLIKALHGRARPCPRSEKCLLRSRERAAGEISGPTPGHSSRRPEQLLPVPRSVPSLPVSQSGWSWAWSGRL